MTAGSDRNLRVLQFTDTHFFKNTEHKLLGVDTSSSFSDVYKLAQKEGIPDFYLFTGDLSQDETEESYKRLSSAVKDAGAPCYFLPGNHDRRKEMQAGLLWPGSPFKQDRRIIAGNWQVILLDTLVDGEVGGHLSETELAFLENSLRQEPDLHALVCLHHHPVAMGARWLDNIGVDNGDEFMNLLSGFPSVKAVLWGHVHQEYESRSAGMLMLATPSTCVQFKRSDQFGVDALPPGYRWLELSPSGKIQSAVVRTSSIAKGLELSSAGY